MRKQCYPTLDDFKHFFIKEGIPPLKGEELLLENGKPISSLDSKLFDKRPKNNSEPGYYAYHDRPPIEFGLYILILERVWCELLRILSNMVHDTKTYDNESSAVGVFESYIETIRNLYLECWKEDDLPAEDGETFDGKKYRGRHSLVFNSMHYKKLFPHYGMLPHAIYACILDFGINHKELLFSRLKQCKYCGVFFIPEQEREGRNVRLRKFYCSDECQVEAGKYSRKTDNSKKKKYRKDKRSRAKDEIIQYLMYKHFEIKKNATDKAKSEISQKAEGVYTKLPDIIKASQKNFLRYWRQKYEYATE